MKIFYNIVLTTACIFFLNGKTYATHAAGMDLTYQCLGPNLFAFSATFYRDCAGIDAPATMILIYRSESCGILDSVEMPNVFTTQGSDTISHLAGLCPDETSICAGGTYQGYEQYIYGIVMSLPAICNDWVISTYVNARNGAITNLFDPGNQNLFEECHLSNANNLCDNSPVFSTIPLAYSCVNQVFVYNNGAYDPDGDSLTYKLVNPLTGDTLGSSIPYSSTQLSATYPLFTTDGTFGFDPFTGEMSCYPNSQQIVVISVLVDEYRDGVWIGSVQRDLQVVIKDCNDNVPEIPDGIVNIVGGFPIDSNTVMVCPGSTVDFDLIGTDIDLLDSITMTTNLLTIIPDASFTVTGVNPDTMHIQWSTTVGDTGFYIFTVTIKDDACPLSGQQIYSFTIQVGANVDAGPDLYVCVTNPVVQLSVVGLTPYLWNNAQYLNNPSLQNPMATLPGLGTYEFVVTAGVGTLCENTDTVLVTVHDDFTDDVSTFPDTLCAGQQVELFASASGGIGNFSYSWSSIPSGFSSTNDTTSATPLVPTDYIVTITSGGCVHNDTLSVDVLPLPNAAIAIDTVLCEGEVTNASVTGGVVSTNTYDWDFSAATIHSGSGAGPYQVSWDTSGNFPVTLAAVDQFGCSSSAVVTVEVNPNPAISFNSITGGCEPLEVIFNNTTTGAVSYVWDFGDGATSTETNPTHVYNEGVYTVTLTATSDKGCVSSVTLTDYIEVLPVPIACANVLEDITHPWDVALATFHFEDCSQFATSYLWDFGDSTSSTDQNPTHTYTSVDTFYVILTASNKYCSDTEKIGPIIIVKYDQVHFPTAFSPNDDNLNDFFHEIGGLGITELYYAVYDRWGELIYETSNMNAQGWDGTYSGKDCEVGVYVWIANATFISGDHFNFKGNVTLVR